MTKSELIAAIALKTGGTKAEAQRNLDAFQEVVKAQLKSGDKITLTGFGTFKVSERKARIGRNPQTGAEIKIPACKVAQFSIGKDLKDSLK